MSETESKSQYDVLNEYFIRLSGVPQGYILTQPAITCSKLTIETLEQSVKYVQN